VLVAIAVWYLQPLLQKLWREALRRKVELVVTKDEFRFRRSLHWISFDRALEHSFALVVHDRAREERDRNELEMLKAQQQRKVAQPKRYYQDSYHLTYQFLRQFTGCPTRARCWPGCGPSKTRSTPAPGAVTARLQSPEISGSTGPARSRNPPMRDGDRS